MGCLGSLMVWACSMPSLPYQLRSRISPIQAKSHVKSGLWSTTISIPFESVVRSKPAHKGTSQINVAGVFVVGTYWDRGTSRRRCPEKHGHLPKRLRDFDGFNTVQIPLSIPSAPSRMAASKLPRVFSGYAAEACVDSVRRDTRGHNHGLHRGDPSTLAMEGM
jgi:hypothetical protein